MKSNVNEDFRACSCLDRGMSIDTEGWKVLDFLCFSRGNFADLDRCAFNFWGVFLFIDRFFVGRSLMIYWARDRNIFQNLTRGTRIENPFIGNEKKTLLVSFRRKPCFRGKPFLTFVSSFFVSRVFSRQNSVESNDIASRTTLPERQQPSNQNSKFTHHSIHGKNTTHGREYNSTMNIKNSRLSPSSCEPPQLPRAVFRMLLVCVLHPWTRPSIITPVSLTYSPPVCL